MVNASVVSMWIVHVFEAAYTVILAKRYETTFVVGMRRLARWGRERKTN